MPDGARDVLVGGTGEDSFVTHHRQVKIGDRYYIQPYLEDEQRDFNRQYELYDDRFNQYDPQWRDRWVIMIV
jgi:hypothetical protein